MNIRDRLVESVDRSMWPAPPAEMVEVFFLDVIEYVEGLEAEAEKHSRAIEATREVNRRLIAEKLELLARVAELEQAILNHDYIDGHTESTRKAVLDEFMLDNQSIYQGMPCNKG